MTFVDTGNVEASVDVLLPAYNGAAIIGNAIASALQQDVPLRVLVIDDGSVDNSADVARSFGPRVQVTVQDNRGVSAARNAALAQSRAPFVAFLDQDDVWSPGKLRRQLDLMQQHPDVGLVFTDMTILTPAGAVIEDGFLRTTRSYSELVRQPVGDRAFLLSETIADAVTRYNFMSPSTVLARRDALTRIGGFDEQFRLCDDADCWMRLLKDWRAIAIEETLVKSYRWGGNASLVRWRGMIEERLRIGEKVLTHPELFPPGAPEYFRRARPVALHRLGIGLLRTGDTREARRFLAASFREGRRPQTLLALLATTLPAIVRKPLLGLKRAAGVDWSVRTR